MNPYRKQIFFAAAIFGVLLIATLITYGFYPILVVNGSPVTAHRFDKIYRAALLYQGNFIKTYAPSASGTTALLSGKDLEIGILNQLVDMELIDAGVRREVGGDLPELIAGKIEKYDDRSDLKTAAVSLFGITYADFRKEVLIPQAEWDILAGRLYLRGESIDKWLADARRSAEVIVFSKRFRWDGSKITVNE